MEPASLGRLQSAVSSMYPQEDLAERVYEVQGKKATSGEYNVALALEQLGLDYTFQLSILGGRSVAGGIVLDFLVDTVPLPTPLWVHGEYWHSGAQRAKDMRQQALVDQESRGGYAPAVEIWFDECDTPEKALDTVRRKLT